MDIMLDKRQNKFYTILKDMEYSLEYNEINDRLWEFHCYVNNSKEKQIVEALIDYALYYMKRKNIKLLESGCCQQVKEYLLKKQELMEMVRY